MTNREMFDILLETMQNLDYDYRSYSGRCMYGKECIGFVTDHPEDAIFTLGAELAEYGIVSMLCVKMDNMGMDTIVYFPDISWPDDVDKYGDDG